VGEVVGEVEGGEEVVVEEVEEVEVVAEEGTKKE
jgi:hypothetical protein